MKDSEGSYPNRVGTAGTVRLYYDDAGLGHFSATVTDLSPDGRTVYLDRTAFYPTLGGQPHDMGLLAGIDVVDVVDENERVAHCLSGPLRVQPGTVVTGEVLMSRRFDHMQQHTGQHLLSALLADRYGWATVSVHFGAESSTLDVSAPGVSAESLAASLGQIEYEANELAMSDLAVTTGYEDAASAAGLRKASDRGGMLRIVTIEGLDRSACGGTHVSRTGEIGVILLRRAERTRGNLRIEFVCGLRALRQSRKDAELLSRAARLLSAAPAELPDLVAALRDRVSGLEKENRRLGRELVSREARERWEAAVPGGDGIRRVAMVVEGAVKGAEEMVHELTNHGSCEVLVTSASTTSVMLASSPDTGLDAGTLLKSVFRELGGRGGGSSSLAQGALVVPEGQTLEGQLARLRERLGFSQEH